MAKLSEILLILEVSLYMQLFQLSTCFFQPANYQYVPFFWGLILTSSDPHVCVFSISIY
jgi:hypothetical protein